MRDCDVVTVGRLAPTHDLTIWGHAATEHFIFRFEDEDDAATGADKSVTPRIKGPGSRRGIRRER